MKTLHSPFHGVIHGDQWLVPNEFFGFLTTVVMKCASQCHTHWCKSWLDLDERTDHHHQQRQQESKVVGHPVGDVVLGGLIIEACQNAGQERPERDWLIVGNVKCLVKEHRVREPRTAAGTNRTHMDPQAQPAAGSTYNSFCGKARAHCLPACPLSFAGALNGVVVLLGLTSLVVECTTVSLRPSEWVVFN